MESWKPEYVISVKKARNGEKFVSSQTLGKLESALKCGGFSIQIVKGNDSETDLVFIKLEEKKYMELVEAELEKFVRFGITAKNTSDLDRTRLIHEYLTRKAEDTGIGINPSNDYWKDVDGFAPVKENYRKSSLIQDIQKAFKKPTLDSKSTFKEYGVQTSLYFEFLNYYTRALIPLAIIGVVSSLKSKKSFLLTYSFINLIWGTTFIVLWNRREKYLVNFWGVQNSSKLDENQTCQNEELSIKKDKIVSAKKGLRFMRQIAFIPIALIFAFVLIAFQLACFIIEIFLTEIYVGPGRTVVSLLPTILLTVFVPILTMVYNLVSSRAVSWEQHDNSYSKNNSILFKSFVLNFLTTYMPLLITSFIYLPFAHLIQPNLNGIRQTISSSFNENHFYYKYLIDLKTQEDFKMNQERLSVQYHYFIVTNNIIQLILKYVLPLTIRYILLFLTKRKPSSKELSNEELWIQEVRKSLQLPEYNADDDFRGLILQYGFLIVFGPIWSLAPVVAIFFNLLTLRLDFFKISSGKYFRPIINNRVDSIYPWNYVLFILTWLGSIVSPLVTVFYRHGTEPPKIHGEIHFGNASVNVSSYNIVFLLLISEHAFFIVYFIQTKISEFFKSDVEWHNLEVNKESNPNARKESLNTDEVVIGEMKDSYLSGKDFQSTPYSENITDSISELENVKDVGDKIIKNTDKNGNISYSTIDNNEHFVPSSPETGTLGDDQTQDMKLEDEDEIPKNSEDSNELSDKGDSVANDINTRLSSTDDKIDTASDSVEEEVGDKSSNSSSNQKMTRRKTLKNLFKNKN